MQHRTRRQPRGQHGVEPAFQRNRLEQLISDPQRLTPPAGVVAAAEQEYHAMRKVLADLLPTVRGMLADGRFSELEVITDVWLTLQYNPPDTATMLGAVAILQLAQEP